MFSKKTNFECKYSFDQRLDESARVLRKHPERVPVICEKLSNSNAPQIDKVKFLVPIDLQMGQFLFMIRQRIGLEKEEALFLFVNNKLIPNHVPVGRIYQEEKSADGFLYVLYTKENTFG